LHDLPVKLQQDLLWESRRPDIAAHPLFSYFDEKIPHLFRCICHTGLVPQFALRGEVIFFRQEACSRMLAMHSGATVYFAGISGAAARTRRDSEPHLDAAGREAARFARDFSFDETKPYKETVTERLEPFPRAPSLASDSSVCDVVYVTDRPWGIPDTAVRGFLKRKDEGTVPHTAQGFVKNGSWICEAALWCKWESKGVLEASSPTCLLELQAPTFARIIGEYTEGFQVATNYATTFVKELTDAGQKATDLFHAPMRRDSDQA